MGSTFLFVAWAFEKRKYWQALLPYSKLDCQRASLISIFQTPVSLPFSSSPFIRKASKKGTIQTKFPFFIRLGMARGILNKKIPKAFNLIMNILLKIAVKLLPISFFKSAFLLMPVAQWA